MNKIIPSVCLSPRISSLSAFQSVVYFLLMLSLIVLTFFSIGATGSMELMAQTISVSDMQEMASTPQRTLMRLSGEWQRNFEGVTTTVELPRSETEIGTFRYKRTVALSKKALKNKTWYLYCLGSQYKTDVYINREYVQTHVGGTIPFHIPIPISILLAGENTIEMVVSNELDAFSTLPLLPSVYSSQTYGGVLRDMFLVGTPHVWTSNLRVVPKFRDNYRYCLLNSSLIITSGKVENILLRDSLGGISAIGERTDTFTVEAQN
jgi:hypothetical protein